MSAPPEVEALARVIAKARFLDGGIEDDDAGWDAAGEVVGLQAVYLELATALIAAGYGRTDEAMERAAKVATSYHPERAPMCCHQAVEDHGRFIAAAIRALKP